MDSGYLFVHRSTIEASGDFRVSPTKLNGTNRVFHRDPVCSGSGRHGGDDIVVISTAVREEEGRLVAVLETGKTPVKECRHCHDYRSPADPNAERWRASAVCQDDPGPHFSPIPYDRAVALEACSRCPSRVPCLKYAVDTNQVFGIWGGRTERERGVSEENIRLLEALTNEDRELHLDLVFEEAG